MRARQKEIYDQDGNLLRIEVTLENGEHLFDVLWDPKEEQNEKNRLDFREWTKLMVKRKGHELS